MEALARTQVILTRHAGIGNDLKTMVQDELLTQAAQSEQVTIEGPEVHLSAKAAELLTLAVHKLATNATKYGALSDVAGKVQVRWTLEDAGRENTLTL